MYKLILYGSGQRCINLCKILYDFSIKVQLLIVDSNPNKWGETVEGYQIESPDRIRECQNSNLCITVGNVKEIKRIRKKIQENGLYDLKREISYNALIIHIYMNNKNIRAHILKQRKENRKNSIIFDSITGLGLGGIEAWTKDICGALIESGEENVYIISNKENYEIPFILKSHIVCAEINLQVRYSVNLILELIDIIFEKMPCKIVASMVNEVMLAAYLIKSYFPDSIEIISVIHGGAERYYNDQLDFDRNIDVYIGVSQDIRECMINKGVDSRKIFTISCPFSCENILNRRYTENIAKPIHVGYAGRLEYGQKRIDLFLELIKVLEKKEIFYQIAFAGEGVARQDMENFIYSEHLNDKVKILGRLDRIEIPNFWKQQDICVNLADFEGRSISVAEAMGNGAVPVVTATSGVREDITDGVNGYIVPIGDYIAVAERIEYLAGHRQRLYEMGQLAHDAVYPKSLMEPHLIFWKKILNLK